MEGRIRGRWGPKDDQKNIRIENKGNEGGMMTYRIPAYEKISEKIRRLN